MKDIGFIGLGIMGQHMAANLLKQGLRLYVNDIVPQAVEKIAAMGGIACTQEEVAEKSEIIILMLPRGDISRTVTQNICNHAQAGTMIIDMSSVTAEDSLYCSSIAQKAGLRFLDAPVSGGEEGARSGNLTIMVGGKAEDFEAAHPLFEFLGSHCELVGPTGSGSVAKLINQIIVNLNIAALSEAFVFGRKAGADLNKVFQVIRYGLAGSQVMEDKAPRMIEHDFRPGGKISINYKDIHNAKMSAEQLGLDLPLTNKLFSVLEELMSEGCGSDDHSAIIKYFEKRAGLIEGKE